MIGNQCNECECCRGLKAKRSGYQKTHVCWNCHLHNLQAKLLGITEGKKFMIDNEIDFLRSLEGRWVPDKEKITQRIAELKGVLE